MPIARRIIPRNEVFPAMRHEQAQRERDRCRASIELDGTEYRCGRRRIDGHHEGIHDAFVEHTDRGAVRW